jgi:hypothetical protein
MNKNNAIRLLLTVAALGCAQDSSEKAATADTAEKESAMTQPDPTDRIAVAMSAAPASIASAATIMDFDATGKLVQLRAGTNGWLCIADDTPAAPGDSPDCLDQTWQAWFEAYEQKKVPKISGVGLAYMLQGSLSPSNTDPFAEKPAPGSDWMKDGPHVMVILPDPAQLDTYSSDHTSGKPYVMYKGTPYAHLMMPVSVKQGRP